MLRHTQQASLGPGKHFQEGDRRDANAFSCFFYGFFVPRVFFNNQFSTTILRIRRSSLPPGLKTKSDATTSIQFCCFLSFHFHACDVTVADAEQVVVHSTDIFVFSYFMTEMRSYAQGLFFLNPVGTLPRRVQPARPFSSQLPVGLGLPTPEAEINLGPASPGWTKNFPARGAESLGKGGPSMVKIVRFFFFGVEGFT